MLNFFHHFSKTRKISDTNFFLQEITAEYIYITSNYLQEKVYQEIEEVCSNPDRPLTAPELNNLTYMEQCISETMRRFNGVPLLSRHTEENLTLRSTSLLQYLHNLNYILRGVL